MVWLFCLGLFLLLASPTQASFLKAYGLWPAVGLRKAIVYQDPKKGNKVAFVAGATGIYVVDVTDSYHPRKVSFTEDLPQPTQVQSLFLAEGKKPSLWVADGSGGVCVFSASAKGLSKPKCLETEGFAHDVLVVSPLLLVANGEGVSLWDMSGKEWLLLEKQSTSGRARNLSFSLVDPSYLEPSPKEIEGAINGERSYLVGYVYVADDWGGIKVFKLEKVVTYESAAEGTAQAPQGTQSGQTQAAKSQVVAETFRLAPFTSWSHGTVERLSGAGGLLAASVKGQGIRLFKTAGGLQELAFLGEEVHSGLKEVRDVFLAQVEEHRFFLFATLGRSGLAVFSLSDWPEFSAAKVAENPVAGLMQSVFVDKALNFYAVDRQAGLLTGPFPDQVPIGVEVVPPGKEDGPSARITVGDPGPFAGGPAFFCVWLEIPECEGARGFSACKALGFEEDKLRWRSLSYVLESAEEMTYSWREGRHCFPVLNLSPVEGLEVLRPDQGFSDEELDGARLHFCLDVDADLSPDLCTEAVFSP